MGSLTFYLVYFGLLFADLILIYTHPDGTWRPLIEPLMMILLILHFRQKYTNENTCDPRLVNIALGCILLGGIFLMYDSMFYSFLTGFCFFLIANLAYTLLFYRCADLSIKRAIPFIVIASLVAMTLLYYFYDALGPYFIPASIFLFVMLNCLQAAYLRYPLVNRQSYYLVFTGVLVFFISQVAAAIFHFIDQVKWVGFLVISTFFISQFLIINGVLKNKAEIVRSQKSPLITNSPEEN